MASVTSDCDGLSRINGVNGMKGGIRNLRAVPSHIDQVDGMPAGFELRSDGLFWLRETGEGEEWIKVCGPLRVLSCSRAGVGVNYGRVLSFEDIDGHAVNLAVRMSLLADRGINELRKLLMDAGLVIEPSKAAEDGLRIFLLAAKPSARTTLVDKLGWYQDGRFVTPDRIIGTVEDGEQLVLATEASAEPHRFNASGSLDEWKLNVAGPAVGNHLLTFGISCAFAAPVLEFLGMPGQGYNFKGPSSRGKTTIGLAAGSAAGGGHAKYGFMRSWKSTANGLEPIAAQHNDNLLVLDELGLLDPQVAAETAYMLVGGVGKARANRDGRARPPAEWRVILLSTGEVSIGDLIKQGRHHAPAGALIRMVDIPCDIGEYGAFDDLHGDSDGQTFANRVQAAALRYYGTALPAYLTELVSENRADVVRKLREAIENSVAEIPGADPQVGRVAYGIAMVGAVGELATRLGITGWTPGDSTKAAMHVFAAWLDRRGSSTISTEMQDAVRQIRLFFEQHGDDRFGAWGGDGDEDEDKNARGKNGTNELMLQPRPVQNRAGFWRDFPHGREFYVFPETFTTELCHGSDPRAVAQELIQKELLVKGSDNKSSDTVYIPALKGRKRMYHFTANIIE